MTKEEIKLLSDKDFRDWMTRLIKDNKIKEMAYLCEIRLNKDKKLKERKDID